MIDYLSEELFILKTFAIKSTVNRKNSRQKYFQEMKIPDNREIFEGKLATFWFDEDGILCAVGKNIHRTLEMQQENYAFIKQITDNKKVCLLSDTSNGSPQDKETREYSVAEMPNIFKAMAVLSTGVFGQTIAKTFIATQHEPIPIKLFSDEREAKEWLKQFL